MNVMSPVALQLVPVCYCLSTCVRWILLQQMRVSPRSTSGAGWWRSTQRFGVLDRCPKAEASTWPSRTWAPACPSWLSEYSTRSAPASFKTLPTSPRYAPERHAGPSLVSLSPLFADADRSGVHFVGHRSGKLHLQRRGSGRAHKVVLQRRWRVDGSHRELQLQGGLRTRQQQRVSRWTPLIIAGFK